MSVISVFASGENTYVTCSTQDENINVNIPTIYTISDNKIVSKIRLTPKDEVFFSDIKIFDNKILLIGVIPTGTGEEMQGYIGLFDFDGKEFWTVKLEKLYEGIEKTFITKDYFEVITNGEKGLFAYKINYQGKVLNKKEISEKNYIHDAIKLNDSGYLILSDSLNSKGESVCLKLTQCDINYNITKFQSIESVKSFLPTKFVEYTNGFIIAGNVDSEGFIPYLFFVGKDLRLKKLTKYHFEPDNYKFKSSFQIKDIQYSPTQNEFVACGVAKIVTDETNIIFTLNMDKLLSYKLLDLTGIWGNNKVYNISNNSFDIVTDIKTNDDFDTKIKMINIKK